MKGRRIGGIVLAAALIVTLAPAIALPWGWATHTYLVKQLAGDDADAIYGALVPDMGQVMDPTLGGFIQEQTHHKFSKLVGKGFAMGLPDTAYGFASHNEFWGADNTAHNPVSGYVTLKTAELVALTGLDGQLYALLLSKGIPDAEASPLAAQFAGVIAHEAVEYAVDILLEENQDPAVGASLADAAFLRNPRVPDLIARAYGHNFAARFQLADPAAESLLREGESDFQGFMVGYGSLLTLSDRQVIVGALAQQGADRLHAYVLALTGLDVTVPAASLAPVLNAAFLVTDDYGPALDATLGLLRRDLSLRIRDIE